MSMTTNPIKKATESEDRWLISNVFERLSDVPPEIEWFVNFTNQATKSAYQNAIKDFMVFIGIKEPRALRSITRSHVIAWRDDLSRRNLNGSTIRHRLAALSSLYEYLCESNAVTHNPVKGVKRPKIESYEGRTPALGDDQARQLLQAPKGSSLREIRDRAILATLLYHALRRAELCKLRVTDYKHERRGVPHLKVFGKGGKIRYVPLHPVCNSLITEYLVLAGHSSDEQGALFRPLKNKVGGDLSKAISTDGIYKIVRRYSTELGFAIGVHSLRATAATNALDNQADIAKVQEWLGHANIATTRIYDHRQTRIEDSPTFKVNY
jgi:integrase/recombinase XerD